jgi:AraC-like DNA-binding protein
MGGRAHRESGLSKFEASLRAPHAIDHRFSRIRNTQVQPGLSLLQVDFRVTSAVVVDAETFPAVCMSIVLDGYAEGRTRAIETGFRPGEVWIASTNDHVPTRKVVLPGHPVRTVELVVTPHWFEQAEARFGDDPAFDGMRAVIERPTTTRRRALDARLKQIAFAVHNPPGEGAIGALYLESRALDLLALLAAEFQGGDPSPRPANLAAHALDRIVAVRERIDRDPSALTTIAALAAEFGMSASKLKQDFVSAFARCPGNYINERRLLLGRELIERHSASVSEAAYRAGYAHPGNFTAAFRRRFGYPPSALKRFS